MDLEFGREKYWQITFLSPNSPKFSPATVSVCAIQYIKNVKNARDEGYLKV